jgi:hypothetical protein
MIDKEHEYEAQDEGDPDDVRDRIVLVYLTPLPLLILAGTLYADIYYLINE